MKSEEKINAFKDGVETLDKKLADLTEEEMDQVAGGEGHDCMPLEDYLKKTSTDKSEILVDKGDGVKLPLDSEVPYEETNNVYVLPRP